MPRGAKSIYLVGLKALDLADHLNELSTHLAAIDPLEDETSRRETMVVVRETVAVFRELYRELRVAMAKATTLLEKRGQEGSVGVRHTDDG